MQTRVQCSIDPAARAALPSTVMAERFLFRGFKSSCEIFESRLGTLEREVMTLVWACGEISVREACERLGSSVAYTTVMTTMDRLYKKQLLHRRKVGEYWRWFWAPPGV